MQPSMVILPQDKYEEKLEEARAKAIEEERERVKAASTPASPPVEAPQPALNVQQMHQQMMMMQQMHQQMMMQIIQANPKAAPGPSNWPAPGPNNWPPPTIGAAMAGIAQPPWPAPGAPASSAIPPMNPEQTQAMHAHWAAFFGTPPASPPPGPGGP